MALIRIERDNTMTDSLSFTRRREDGKLILWAPERPTDYDAACDAGAGYARELTKLIRATGDPTRLGAVFRAIVRGGEYSGVEVGFCHEIGEQLAGKRRPILAEAA